MLEKRSFENINSKANKPNSRQEHMSYIKATNAMRNFKINDRECPVSEAKTDGEEERHYRLAKKSDTKVKQKPKARPRSL